MQFVLDHCGVPDIKGGAEHPWREHMSEIAKRPNVAGKISGVVAYADPDSWTVATLRPYVEHTIGAFGWDRVVWGSDWPVCTLGGGLSTWVAATHALIAGASADETAASCCRRTPGVSGSWGERSISLAATFTGSAQRGTDADDCSSRRAVGSLGSSSQNSPETTG